MNYASPLLPTPPAQPSTALVLGYFLFKGPVLELVYSAQKSKQVYQNWFILLGRRENRRLCSYLLKLGCMPHLWDVDPTQCHAWPNPKAKNFNMFRSDPKDNLSYKLCSVQFKITLLLINVSVDSCPLCLMLGGCYQLLDLVSLSRLASCERWGIRK